MPDSSIRRVIRTAAATGWPLIPGGAVDEDDLYADTVASVLELEEIDRNLYRGRNATTARLRRNLYGGQVAAQALKAAGLTVPAERRPHSLHGYFLRPGRIDRPVLLKVDRDRDGGSFSARHVAAVQDGEVIFSMLASFHRGESHDVIDAIADGDVPPVPEGEAVPFRDPLVERRFATHLDARTDDPLPTSGSWLRTTHPLPDDPLDQACGLTYLSDFGSGFERMRGGAGTGGPSLDHAVWFHLPVRADDWLLLHMRPRKATRIRGLYDGTVRDPSGRLGAIVEQECLFRRWSAPGEQSAL